MARGSKPAAGYGRQPKGELKRRNRLGCHITDRHKKAVEEYCAAHENLSMADLLYKLLTQVVPDPDA